MDPILAQKTAELYAKLTKARAAGAQISPDDIEAWMRRETNNKYGLADAQGYVQSLGNMDSENVAGSIGQGATFDWLDEARGKALGPEAEATMRLRDKAFSGKHPLTAGGLKLAGAVLSPAVLAALAPEAIVGGAATGGAMLLRAALGGAGAAGTAAAGHSEAPDVGGRAKAAALPAVAGAFLGPAAALGTKAVGAMGGGIVRGLTENADATAVRRAGRLMPQGLEQQAARHEMLAPGSFIPAAASEEATAIGRGVGASPRAALKAIDDVRAKWGEVRAAKRALKGDYDALGKSTGPLKIDSDLRDLLHTVGEDSYGPSIHFDRLQRLRTRYREKMGSTNSSNDQQVFGDFVDGVTKWLEPRVKGLSEIDSRYKFLSQSEQLAEKLYNEISQGNKSHGVTSLFGGESGSIGGSLPKGNVASIASKVLNAVNINRAGRAEAVARQLLQPADASQVAALAQSRAAAMAPRVPTPGSNFVAPVGGSDAIMTFFKMLSEPLPDQLRSQAGPQ